MAGKELIAAERLRELLHYDPATGCFTWRVDRMCGRYGKQFAARAGQSAGNLIAGLRPRVQLRVEGKNYKAHRLAWLYAYGEWPAKELDHVDGDATNNRINNLRLATRRLNNQNHRRPNQNNRLQVQGVKKNWNRFVAQLCVDGKTRYVGSFATAAEAHQAYLSAKRQHHEGCTL